MKHTALNQTFGTILTTTWRKVRTRIVDQVTDDLLLLHWLRRKDRIVEEDGGTSIQIPVMIGLNNTFTSYSGYEPLEITPQEGITSAFYPWRQVHGGVTISGIEAFQNGGGAQIIKATSAKTAQAVVSYEDEVHRQLMGDGLGNDGKDILGLEAIVPVDPTNDMLGMIDSSSNTFWQSKASDLTGVTSSAVYRRRLYKLYNQCSKGRSHPTILIGHLNAWENYAFSLEANERFMDNESVSYGYQGLLLRQAPFFYDKSLKAQIKGATASTDAIYMLNDNHIQYVVAKGNHMAATDFVRTTEQDAWKARVQTYHQLVTDLRATQGVAYDIPQSFADISS